MPAYIFGQDTPLIRLLYDDETWEFAIPTYNAADFDAYWDRTEYEREVLKTDRFDEPNVLGFSFLKHLFKEVPQIGAIELKPHVVTEAASFEVHLDVEREELGVVIAQVLDTFDGFVAGHESIRDWLEEFEQTLQLDELVDATLSSALNGDL